jgi:hypothetical protein
MNGLRVLTGALRGGPQGAGLTRGLNWAPRALREFPGAWGGPGRSGGPCGSEPPPAPPPAPPAPASPPRLPGPRHPQGFWEDPRGAVIHEFALRMWGCRGSPKNTTNGIYPAGLNSLPPHLPAAFAAAGSRLLHRLPFRHSGVPTHHGQLALSFFLRRVAPRGLPRLAGLERTATGTLEARRWRAVFASTSS